MQATIRDKDKDEEQLILDPIPKTHAGQARHFYYETDEADLLIKSKDYDSLYARTNGKNQLAELGKSATRHF